ncbi:hypothetical protein A3709_01970 [Halioglobus sp. HI00S01]|nr:hypothetical protein A3709_01970 [Halioglobus sp. HI00S01]
MPAGVDKCIEPAVTISVEQQRHSTYLCRHEITWISQLTHVGNQQGILPEQDRELTLQPFSADVVVDAQYTALTVLAALLLDQAKHLTEQGRRLLRIHGAPY